MEIKEHVLKTLKEKGVPMKSKEIAESTGIEKAEIDKAIELAGEYPGIAKIIAVDAQ